MLRTSYTYLLQFYCLVHNAKKKKMHSTPSLKVKIEGYGGIKYGGSSSLILWSIFEASDGQKLTKKLPTKSLTKFC